MRILIFSPVFPPAIGGPSTQALNLCRALVKKGETPIVVTYGGDHHSFDEALGFKVYGFRTVYTHTPFDKAIRWIVFPFYISKLLRKEEVDILHCNSASALSFVAAFVARIKGIPRVLKFAGDWVWETLSTHKLTDAKDFKEIYTSSLLARFMTMIERYGVNQFDIIWTPSEFRKKNIKDLLGTDEKTIIIPNCLLLSGGGSHASLEEDIVVVSANRFIPHKRVSLIVESFARMNVPNSILVLIGGGSAEEVQKVKDAIAASGMPDRIKLKGILSSEEVYENFSRSSFYVSASLEEGFPNVFIEAMNYGLPIIAMDEGGSKELVLHDETGFMLKPNDTVGLVDTMHKLSTDAALRIRMSQAAYERSKHFNLEYRIDEFISMYKKILKR